MASEQAKQAFRQLGDESRAMVNRVSSKVDGVIESSLI